MKEKEKMEKFTHQLQRFLVYFWQNYRYKLIILAVISALVGLLYYIGITDEGSYLWVNVISEDLNLR